MYTHPPKTSQRPKPKKCTRCQIDRAARHGLPAKERRGRARPPGEPIHVERVFAVARVSTREIFRSSRMASRLPRWGGLVRRIQLCNRQGKRRVFFLNGARCSVYEKRNPTGIRKAPTPIPSIVFLLQASAGLLHECPERTISMRTGCRTTGKAGISATIPPLRLTIPMAMGRTTPPTHPLPKPETGNYRLIRLIRSNGLLDVFGEKFSVPPECICEYVRATVDVSEQDLCIHPNDLVIDEKKYLLR